MYLCSAETEILFILVVNFPTDSMLHALFCLKNVSDRCTAWAHVVDSAGDVIISDFPLFRI